jgi:hypothetical protein
MYLSALVGLLGIRVKVAAFLEKAFPDSPLPLPCFVVLIRSKIRYRQVHVLMQEPLGNQYLIDQA